MQKILTVLLSVLVAFAALSSVSGCSSEKLGNGYKYTLTPVEKTSEEELEAAAKIIEKRLLNVFSNAEVKKQDGKLSVKTTKIDNPDYVMKIVCEDSIEFRDSKGNVRLRGEHVKTANAGYDENGNPAVFLELTNEGTKLFAEATRKIADGEDGVENVLYVYLGSIMIFAPEVTAEIPNGLAIINDLESYEKAKAVVAVIKGGRLSVGFNVARENT